MNPAFTSHVGRDDEGRRLDRILRIALGGIPLSAIHKALRKGDVRVNGERRSPDYRCREGDVIEFSRVFAGLSKDGAQSSDARLPGALPSGAASVRSEAPSAKASGLRILLETDDLLFIDKPLGVLVHDGDESLDAMVGKYLSGRLAASLAFRPGPLHRLDRNTSGVIAFSKSIAGARNFSQALRDGRCRKTYLGLVQGMVAEEEVWTDGLRRDASLQTSFVDLSGCREGDKAAVTEIIPLARGRGLTLAAFRLGTGRTHQIRSQAAHHGHPLLGDAKYGGERCELPYYLHAWRLGFEGSIVPDLPAEVEAPLPAYFLKKALAVLSAEENELYSMLRRFQD